MVETGRQAVNTVCQRFHNWSQYGQCRSLDHFRNVQRTFHLKQDPTPATDARGG